jgi:HSP90 family molecular chaperone
VDFKPVSEFGIGFMAVFMLGNRVEVETASWASARSDGSRRVLRIDGLGKLIEISEEPNVSSPRFYGTRVSITLSSGDHDHAAPGWEAVTEYVRAVCKNVEFPLTLQRVNDAGTLVERL